MTLHEQLLRLRAEAIKAGDLPRVALCTKAIQGDAKAVIEVLKLIDNRKGGK